MHGHVHEAPHVSERDARASGSSTSAPTIPPLRDRLVLTFAPLVKYIVYKKVREMPARCEVEDFISCGLEALIQSIDRYDPARARRSSSTRGPASTAPCSTSCAARTGPRAPSAAGSATSRRPPTSSPRCTAAARSSEELAESMGTTVEELRQRRDEITRSDLTSLNTLVLSDDETTIERMDTLASTDERLDPEHAAADRGGQGQVPRGVRASCRA